MQYAHGMSTNAPISTYWDQLRTLAAEADYDLLQAFLDAGVADSTFYRARETGQIRYETARKVAEVLNGKVRCAA